MADIRQVKKYAVLCNEKAKLERELKQVKGGLTKLEAPVLEYFADQGVQSVNVEGRTLSLRKEVWAKQRGDFSNEERMVLVQAAGYPELVKESVNTNTLSSLFRERMAEGLDAVPAKLACCYEASESYKIGSIKSVKA